MKPYQLAFLLLLLFFAACKKDAKQAPSGPIYLVKYQIGDLPQTNFKKDTLLYQYDDKNRLSDYGKVYYGKYTIINKFLYDSKDRVNEVDYYDTSGNLAGSKTILTYGSSTITVKTYSTDGTLVVNDKFTLNKNQEIIRYDTYNYYELMNYDKAGNLISYQNYPEPGAIESPVSMYMSLTYDNNKNPFSALNENVFIKEYFFNNSGWIFTPRSFVNNALYSSFEYQYNGDGYPTKVVNDFGGATTYYEYIVK